MSVYTFNTYFEMSQHQGTSFNHSCVKVPVDPYSRQPTPSYERPRILKSERCRSADKGRRINFAGRDLEENLDPSSPRETLENFLEFMESIPDYGDVNHLTNEQFKQKLDYLKRRQRTLLKNLRNRLDEDDRDEKNRLTKTVSDAECNKIRQWCNDYNNLSLKGKKCSFEESRVESPLPFPFGTITSGMGETPVPSGKFAGLAEDQDLLTYRCKDKDAKTLRNREIHSAGKSWSIWSECKSVESVERDSDAGDSVETRSLPPNSPKRGWHPTVPKPFNFTLREEAEKYMSFAERQAEEEVNKEITEKKIPVKKRYTRPIPLTSKIQFYDKLLAEKEERSRIVREESAWSLMSQVRPFKLESARRALTRSSPELCPTGATNVRSAPKFRAKPVPRSLFSAEVYDRMLEDDFYRTLQKKVRAAEMLKSSSLPPSMAKRERAQSANAHLRSMAKEFTRERIREGRESTGASVTPLPTERSRSAMTSTSMSTRGNNLAAVLRCQASREKMEREIQNRMVERHREQSMRARESVLRRRPAWKALRAAARQEHERDLAIRASLRRDEAREQAERHRLHMELMLGRVTQIPTLFERHSQSFQASLPRSLKSAPKIAGKPKKKKKIKRHNSESVDSYQTLESSYRPNSGSVTSSGTLVSSSISDKSSRDTRRSGKSSNKSITSMSKKRGDRGPLKVSINETAELIQDQNEDNDGYSIDSSPSAEEQGDNISESEDNLSGDNKM